MRFSGNGQAKWYFGKDLRNNPVVYNPTSKGHSVVFAQDDTIAIGRGDNAGAVTLHGLVLLPGLPVHEGNSAAAAAGLPAHALYRTGDGTLKVRY